MLAAEEWQGFGEEFWQNHLRGGSDPQIGADERRWGSEGFQTLETCVAKASCVAEAMQDKMQVRENVPNLGKRLEGLRGEKAVNQKSFITVHVRSVGLRSFGGESR